MLKLIYHLRDLNFSNLLAVYKGSLNGRYAEDQLYDYLLSFFQNGGICAVWTDEDTYVSALRLEPYRDGYLIAGLETAPDARCKGFASMLLSSLCSYLSEKNTTALYAHVSNFNYPSLAVHQKCGFAPVLDHAFFLDGSVDTRSKTLYKKL